METLGQRLKYARTLKKLSMNDIKKETGISTGNYSEWERDIKLPNAKGLIALKRVLEISIDWLLTGKEDINENNLAPEEQKLLKKYRQLNERNKIKIETYTDLRFEEQQVNEVKSSSILNNTG